tara:strand:- start:75 stop:1937 length:1863 start_codon:yes stop_codon:yes gene_type:complete
MPSIFKPALLGFLVALAGFCLTPVPALACGGFFCSQVNVDQTAERILFEVNPDGTITLTVEISLTGDSAAFSWLIPLPPNSAESGTAASDGIDNDGNGHVDDFVLVPTADGLPYTTATPSALMLLDGITMPRIIAPPQNGWEDFADDAAGGFGDDDDGDDAPTEADNGVDVVDLPQVEDYVGELISSTDTNALITWLNDNGYVITPDMYEFVAHYVASGMSFLGIQLAPTPQSGVYSIKPLQLRYNGTVPMIPLTLSAVAAEPEMGFITFVAGADNYEVEQPYQSLEVDTDLLWADPRTGESNYYALISWLADLDSGGKAFFRELADSTDFLTDMVWSVWLGTEDQQAAETFVLDLAGRHDRITRLYSRMSNWEMEVDPTFVPVVGGIEDISNLHDLSGREPVHWDTAKAPPLSCNNTYCGPFGSCATTALGMDGCACNAGSTARAIVSPAVGAGGMDFTVSCQATHFDLGVEDVAGLADPCDGFDCGSMGSCMPFNGSPTCVCAPGYAAVNLGGSLICSQVQQTFLANQLLWPEWPPEVASGDDDDTAGDDDDAVSTDDDDTSDDDTTGSSDQDDGGTPYGGIDSAISCGCDSAAAPGRHDLGLLVLALLVIGARRRLR